MVLASSLLVSAVSDGNSTMRNTEPPRGGMMPMSIAARSAVPEGSAGVWFVPHNNRETVGVCGRTFLCGVAPSSSTTALSLLSIVVTTRRTSALKAITHLLRHLRNERQFVIAGLDRATRPHPARVGIAQPTYAPTSTDLSRQDSSAG